MFRALIIGINYLGQRYALAGCINDAEMCETQLVSRGATVQLLTDLTPDTLPTEKNILQNLFGFCLRTQLDPTIQTCWISYSGHGAAVLDDDTQEESDGRDEVMVCSDGRLIRDDILYEALQLLRCPRTFLLWDCCHSGSAADLPWTWSAAEHQWVLSGRPGIPAQVVMLSSCHDLEVSAEVWADNAVRGALTVHFWAVLQSQPEITWSQLLLELGSRMPPEQKVVLSSSRGDLEMSTPVSQFLS